ncbi:hypothetical protein JR316_0005652 [Psilocybe cubensis]|uniref:Uncharacterized protein n=2 Tax=Psilocybe cubensis TaxID=181762 RepID=A0A8H7XZE1_PSICU|nr:hypothetical protein JR316_0005652 [Psilocybe cubensis]KAH9481132.1 hypothetical protein JR316_0005652 [Psilocybe cubensis]
MSRTPTPHRSKANTIHSPNVRRATPSLQRYRPSSATPSTPTPNATRRRGALRLSDIAAETSPASIVDIGPDDVFPGQVEPAVTARSSATPAAIHHSIAVIREHLQRLEELSLHHHHVSLNLTNREAEIQDLLHERLEQFRSDHKLNIALNKEVRFMKIKAVADDQKIMLLQKEVALLRKALNKKRSRRV